MTDPEFSSYLTCLNFKAEPSQERPEPNNRVMNKPSNQEGMSIRLPLLLESGLR